MGNWDEITLLIGIIYITPFITSREPTLYTSIAMDPHRMAISGNTHSIDATIVQA